MALRSLRLSAVLVTVLFSASGCSGGGGGGSSTIPAPSRIQSIVVSPSLDGTAVTYTLVSPDSHPMSVSVEFSQDRGLSFGPATVSSGETTALAATPQGTEHQLEWAPTDDLPSPNQSDLRLRLTPRDEITGVVGTPATSTVFGLGHNTLPEITHIVTPAGTVGGEISFDFTIRDAEGDVVALDLACSLDAGNTWNTATPGFLGDGSTAVTTTPEGVDRTVSWLAQADADGVISDLARLRVTPRDVESGVAGETTEFQVNLIAPSITLLTLGHVPHGMNGSEGYEDAQGNPVSFHLNVPTFGFEIGVEWESHLIGGDIDPDSIGVTVDRSTGDSPPGTALGEFFDGDMSGAHGSLPVGSELPPGFATFTVTVRDEYGNVSPPESLTLNAVQPSAGARPFDVPDLWWIDFQTDFYTIEFTGGPTVTVVVTPGGNGIPDYLEDLEIIGLRTDTPTAACASLDTNRILFDWLRLETIGRLRELYGGDFHTGGGYTPNLTFTDSPGGQSSAIRVGGDDQAPGFTIGRAQFDYRNGQGNDNRSPTLGIFTTNMIEYYINTSFTFQSRFDLLIPGRGIPVGEHELDHIVLSPSFDRLDPGNTVAENFRYDRIYLGIDAWARSVAVILAHEIGHSVGLVANGTPPAGLFGGVTDAPFSGVYTTEFHLDTPGHNIMASALSFSASLIIGSGGYGFNGLNEEYLAEGTTLGD